MNTINIPTEDLEIAANAILNIKSSIIDTSNIIAEMCRKHSNFINELHATVKSSYSVHFLRRLEKCGNKTLHPEFVFGIGPAQPWVEKLSMRDQEQILKGVVWPEGDTHRIRPISELTYSESRMCFLGGVCADIGTLKRRIAEHTTKQKENIEYFDKKHKRYIAEQENAIKEIEGMGIRIKGKNIIIPKGLTVNVYDFRIWLDSKGY